MKLRRIILMLLLLQCLTNLHAQGWRRHFEPAETDGATLARPVSIVQTPDSGYLSFVQGIPSSSGLLLVKMDQSGDFVWQKPLDVTTQALTNYTKIYPLHDQTYLLFAANPFDSIKLARVDVDGNTLGTMIIPYNIKRYVLQAASNDAGFLLAFNSSDTTTVTDTTILIEQYDVNFNLLWNKHYSLAGCKGAVDQIFVGPDQSIYFSDFSGDTTEVNIQINKLTPDGNLIWTKLITDIREYFSFGGLLVNHAGEIYYWANQLSKSEVRSTAIYKFAGNGNLVWKRSLPDWNLPSSVTPDDGLVLVSHNPFAVEFPRFFTLRKFSAQGNVVLEKYFNALQDKEFYAYSVAATFDGGFMLACEEVYGYHVFIKTDSLGRIHPNYIEGTAKYDLNHNCINNIGEDPLAGWIITATDANGDVFYGLTDSIGAYEINVDTGIYTVKIQVPGPLWETCNNGIYQADLTTLFDTATIDIPVQDSAYCSLLNVSIATTRIRRCFNNTYRLNWQNFGTAPAENVRIDVVLPPELDFVSADPLQPEVIGDTLRFNPGTVPYGASGSLSLVVHADCDSTVLGQTLCVEAWISPDTLCYDIPNWSGAEVIANARCTSDTTVQYTLKNVGNGPTGDLNYIITEDLVVLMTQPFNLNPNQEIQINQAFNGNLQRIIAEQAPNYPFDPVSAAAVETCGGSTNGLGQINQFPLTDGSPFVDIECSTVIGSYDPNDKTGFPLGYGPDHLVEANTDITYLIRFQNTGTDTAFRVVVRDTLSKWLDVVSVQPGPASHPYRWNFEDGNVLVFHFDPIALPDSSVNQDVSNGFVQFRIKQKPNLTDGTEILNTADIYFDYNAAVRTNTTMHRIGKPDYTASVFSEPSESAWPVTVSPNPFSTQTTIRLGRVQEGDLNFELYDQQGHLVRSAAFKSGQYELSAEGLRAGMYTYALMDARGARKGRGQLIVSPK